MTLQHKHHLAWHIYVTGMCNRAGGGVIVGKKNEKYLHRQEFFSFFLVSLGLSGGSAMMDNVYMYNHKLS